MMKRQLVLWHVSAVRRSSSFVPQARTVLSQDIVRSRLAPCSRLRVELVEAGEVDPECPDELTGLGDDAEGVVGDQGDVGVASGASPEADGRGGCCGGW